MALAWNIVYTSGVNVRRCHDLIIFDNKLWVVDSRDNASGYAGRLYYTSDGDNWTWDTNWDFPVELYENSQEDVSSRHTGPFVHDGRLYMACDHLSTAPGVTNTHGHLYRREDNGTWTLIFEEVDQLSPGYRYCRGASDGTNIILVGSVYLWNGSARKEACIWRITGGVKTLEYQDTVHGGNDGGWDALFSTDDQMWYASTDSAVHTRGDGSWPVVYDTGSAFSFQEGGVLYEQDADKIWCGDHRRYLGTWSDMGHPAGHYINGHLFEGEMMLCEARSEDLYTYTNQWNDRGNPAGIGPRLENVVLFKGNIYISGYDGLNGQVWRIELNHQTTAGNWARPTARSLVCDHEFGDTIYFGVYESNGRPVWMKIDDDLDDWKDLDVPILSGGSLIQVQSALVRDTAYAYGFFSSWWQIFVTDDGGETLNNCDNDGWVDVSISTMEYLFADGSDLTITQFTDKELLRTLSGLNPWTKRGDIPGGPLSQIRDENSIFVGCTAGSANLYLSEDIGQVYAAKGVGLPTDVDILDLELG